MLSTLALCLSFGQNRSENANPKNDTENQPHLTSIARLQRWRKMNRAKFEAARVNGMKRSQRVRANLLRIHAECKAEWKASALQNPKLQPTEFHIAARDWTLRSPDGVIHTFRNLKKFVRDNPRLFNEEDILWKAPEGKPQQAWCRAFQGLARLRPSTSKTLNEWQGWTWAEKPSSIQRQTSPIYAPAQIDSFRHVA